MKKTLCYVAGAGVSLALLVCVIFYLLAKNVINYEMALLSLIGLFGLYLGFGVLIAVYRLVSNLE